MKVVHFEIHADDPERAIKFYQDVFGWEITKFPGSEGSMEYWTVDTKEENLKGGLNKREGKVSEGSPNAFVNYIQVPNYDEYAEKIKKAGGTSINEKVSMENVGTYSQFKDTEGNVFAIIETPPGM